MIIVAGQRRSGKTTTLINFCRENNAALITSSRSMARSIMNAFPEMAGKVYSYVEATDGRLRGKGFDCVFVDEAQEILREVMPGVTIAGMSINGKVYKDNGWDK